MNPSKNCLNKFLKYLKELAPNPKCLLTFKKDYQFLIKVMLSAQAKDVMVNKYADLLFTKYKTLDSLSKALIKDIERIIKPLGFYQNKAKNIKNISNDLIEKFKGKIPNNKKDLMTLKGVGNKTANCVLNELFHENFIAVDTHVQRVCKRLNFVSKNAEPVMIETWLYKHLPKEEIHLFSNRTIFFGRNICTAKKPHCFQCKMKCGFSKNILG